MSQEDYSGVVAEVAVGGEPDFRELQRDFARHLRDPLRQPAIAAIEPRRMAIYRELFFNNVDGFLRRFFPVLHSLYSEEDWLGLVRSFYSRHSAETPYFLKIAEEFLKFVESEFEPRPCDPDFLLELAHYEWLELALDVSEREIPATGFEAAGDLMEGIPLASPLAELVHYRWPVQRVSATAAWPAEEATYLLVYRDRRDVVRFQELNGASARLFALIRELSGSEQPFTGIQLATRLAAEMQHPQVDAVIAGARQVLTEWLAREVILGTVAVGEATLFRKEDILSVK